MAISVLLRIDDTDLTSLISEYAVSYEQMFAEANRNMQGALRASYVGTVPKISIRLRHLSQSEMQSVLELLNQSTLDTDWWDEDNQILQTGNFYRSELKPTLVRTTDGLYKSLSVSLIAYDPMASV